MGRPIFIAKQGTGLHDGLKGVPISSLSLSGTGFLISFFHGPSGHKAPFLGRRRTPSQYPRPFSFIFISLIIDTERRCLHEVHDFTCILTVVGISLNSDPRTRQKSRPLRFSRPQNISSNRPFDGPRADPCPKYRHIPKDGRPHHRRNRSHDGRKA